MNEQVTGCSIPTVFTESNSGDSAKLIGSAVKVRELLGWQPQYNLEKIIETAWQWHVK